VLGSSIGNYTLTAKIGEGGMGTVYRAEHATLGRRAAVKVLLPEMSSQRDAIARFFNEARAATAIHHPSIVEIFDFGSLPDGSAYIVMEYLHGESLMARCRRVGRLEPGRALVLARQIAGALGAAHDCGIVHRDLKPDNVFVVPDPEVPGGERVKILDFGIAKLAGDAGGGSRTQTGAVLGTPMYISPEQCRGTGQIDARADLYSLGCVLYELVCGRPPFVVEGAGELIAHHLYFEPQPPRTHEPSLPEPLDRLILWLLRKDPRARPQTARELIAAIDQLDLGAAAGHAASPQAALAGHSLTTLPANVTTLSGSAGLSTVIQPPPRRQRWLTAAVAATIVAGGIAVYAVVAGGRGSRPVQTLDPAPAPASTQAPPPAPPAPQAPTPQPPPAPATQLEPPQTAYVHLAIDSDPKGAIVSVDGKQVGTTPFDERVAAGGPSRTYTLRKAGHDPANLTLTTARDAAEHVVLKKRPPQPPPSLGDKGLNPFDH
jgi:serine/threonine-protein kinase